MTEKSVYRNTARLSRAINKSTKNVKSTFTAAKFRGILIAMRSKQTV